MSEREGVGDPGDQEEAGNSALSSLSSCPTDLASTAQTQLAPVSNAQINASFDAAVDQIS